MGTYITIVLAILTARLIETMGVAFFKALVDESRNKGLMENITKNTFTDGID